MDRSLECWRGRDQGQADANRKTDALGEWQGGVKIGDNGPKASPFLQRSPSLHVSPGAETKDEPKLLSQRGGEVQLGSLPWLHSHQEAFSCIHHICTPLITLNYLYQFHLARSAALSLKKNPYFLFIVPLILLLLFPLMAECKRPAYFTPLHLAHTHFVLSDGS